MVYTYHIVWQDSDISWSSRWDRYLASGSHKVWPTPQAAEACPHARAPMPVGLTPAFSLARAPRRQIHWISVVNSLVIVFVLTGVVALIVLRTKRRDIARYNQDDLEVRRDGRPRAYHVKAARANAPRHGRARMTRPRRAAKLVHGDVFRPPRHSEWLAAFVGGGIQVGMGRPCARATERRS